MFKKQFGKMSISGGIRIKTKGKKPTCQICEQKIIEGDLGIQIKALGEQPREHHFDCIMQVFSFLAAADMD